MLGDLKYICHYYLKYIYYGKRRSPFERDRSGVIQKYSSYILIEERYCGFNHGVSIIIDVEYKDVVEFQYGKRITNCCYTNGYKFYDSYYEDGKEVNCVIYYENGNILSIEHYEDEQLHGVSIMYNMDGTEYRKRTYVEGRLID